MTPDSANLQAILLQDSCERLLCQLINDFDDSWKSGTPILEDVFLEGLPACGDRRIGTDFLRDLLDIEHTRRKARGEKPTFEEYERRFPEWQDAVAAIFPPVLKQLGNYELLSLLGRGGMGEVYKVKNTLTEQVGAVKLIRAHLLEDPQVVSRFELEIKHLARLEGNPHIVSIRTAGRLPQGLFLEMEFIDGINLDSLRQVHKLSIADACELVRQAAEGLAGAHAVGIVHLDIKPLNLMLNRAGTVKILDFGLARLRELACDATASGTSRGIAVGTPMFMPPEQLEGSRSTNGSADVYSLGITLYLLLSGRGPFDGETVLQLVSAIATREPYPLRQFRPDLPAKLQDLVMRMIAKDQVQRIASASDAEAMLRPFSQGHRLQNLASSAIPLRKELANDSPAMAARDTLLLSVNAKTPRVSPPDSPVPLRRQKGRWGTLVFAATLSAITLLLLAIVILLNTKEGKLEVVCNEEGVELEILQLTKQQNPWKVVRSKNETALHAGEYLIRLRGSLGETYELDKDRFEIKKGKRSQVTVSKKPGSVLRPPEGFRSPAPVVNLPSKLARRSQFYGEISAMAFRPLTGSIVFGTRSGELGEYFPQTNKLVLWEDGHEGAVSDISVRDDGLMIVSSSADGTIRLADADGKLVLRIPQTEPIQAAQWRPGKKMFLSQGSDSGLVRVWKEDGSLINGDIDTGEYYAAASGWIDKGERFFTGNGDKTIRYWLPDGTRAGSEPTSGLSGFGCVTPAGDVLTFGEAQISLLLQGPKRWISESFVIRNTFKPAFSPSGNWALLGKSNDKTLLIKLRKVPIEGALFDTIAEIDSGPSAAAAWLDDTHFAIGGKRLSTWSIVVGEEAKVVAGPTLNSYDGLRFGAIAWNPQGDTLAVTAEPGFLGLFTADGKLKKVLAAKGPSYFPVAYSPSGDWLSAGDEHGTVGFWKADGTEGPKFPFSTPTASDKSPVTRLVWNHNESWVAAAWVGSSEVQLFSPTAASGGRGAGMGNEQFALTIGFGPQDDWLAVGLHKNSGIQIWDRKSNYRSIRRISFNSQTELRDQIGALDVHPTEPLIAAGSAYGRAGIVTVQESPHSFIAFKDPKDPGRWFHEPFTIREVAWHPRGQWVACVGGDGRISLWSREGQFSSEMDVGKDDNVQVSWSPSGDYLAAGGRRGIVFVWDFSGRHGAGITSKLRFGPIKALEWSKTDRLAVGTQGGLLSIIDARSRRFVMQTLLENAIK
ncbi:MAG: protein kinase domain-containing protein [Pirellulaceae bacterium]